jgi:SNF family Na+-dependent transporter
MEWPSGRATSGDSRGCRNERGGAFYIAYFLALFLWAIPLLAAEGVGEGLPNGRYRFVQRDAREEMDWSGLLSRGFPCHRLLLPVVIGGASATSVRGNRGAQTESIQRHSGMLHQQSTQGALFFIIALLVSIFIVSRAFRTS